MGIFDRFKKKKVDVIVLPERFSGLVTVEQYQEIMRIAQQYHADAGLLITHMGDGEIVAQLGDEEQHRYLDNLIRLIRLEPITLWKVLIYEHFDKIKDQSTALRFFFNDFEHAEPWLRVLIKPDDFFDFTGEPPGYISKIDFPGTHTYLVFEFENQFNYINASDIVEWEKSPEELFRIAINNIPGEEVDVKTYSMLDRFDVFIFFSGDFSASLLLDLENRADFVLGKYGSMIAIPTKGTAFAHPIETDDILDLAADLAPSVIKFYEEDPGNITTQFYWYYQGKFQAFRLEEKGEHSVIFLPYDLENLLEGQ